MAFTAKRFYKGRLSATVSTTLYTNPGGVTSIIKDIEICNQDSATRTVTLDIGAAGADNRLFNTMQILAGETVQLTGHIVLTTGEIIAGGADSANVVSMIISGVEG
jgi:hypothetical protein